MCSSDLLDALRAVDRARFLPVPLRGGAYLDQPVPIGWGQTCSQPSMVAFMLDQLDLRPGDRLLEIGSGCGYAAAVASVLCGPSGVVYASEIVPELARAARLHCAAGLEGARIVFLDADGSEGFPGYAPFDRILVSAGVSLPSFREEPLLGHLGAGGRLLYPHQAGSLFLVAQTAGGLVRTSWNCVVFVPLVGRGQ